MEVPLRPQVHCPVWCFSAPARDVAGAVKSLLFTAADSAFRRHFLSHATEAMQEDSGTGNGTGLGLMELVPSVGEMSHVLMFF
jgi:hypothetical protein